MRTPRSFRSLLCTVLLCMVGTIVMSAQAEASKVASEAGKSMGLDSTTNSRGLLGVHPLIGKPGQPRTLYFQQLFVGCFGSIVSVDIASMETQSTIVLRNTLRNTTTACPHPLAYFERFVLAVTPTRPGTLSIGIDNNITGQSVLTATDGGASKYDVNGMWFDAATNGSGISLHHRRATTDAAFGTWFMYATNGMPTWYTLQSTFWEGDGSILDGLLYSVSGECFAINLASCPALGSVTAATAQFPIRARITFQSATRARAEVSTLDGIVLFTSELSKLQF